MRILCIALLATTLVGWAGACGDDDGTGPLPELRLHAPLASPEDPLAETEVQSCPVYLEERCEAGTLERCAVYDPAAETFDASPAPLLRRVLLYERWYDLYHQPEGLTVDRRFTQETLPGTPESEWGDPSRFARWDGAGDAAIWTGKALAAYALRYVQTGTEADYQRMERKVRALLTEFDVTGIPGYLARYHFYLMDDPGAPQSDQHFFEYNPDSLDHRDHVFDPAEVDAPDLPALYTTGYDDQQTVWTGTPMWHGNPSIDQYTGPMTAFPMVYSLLRDDSLKQRIARQMTCYLKRLARIEIINLQQNPTVLQAVLDFFAGANVQLDPGDLDFTQIDRIVAFVHRQVNSRNSDDFDRSCPEGLPYEPWRVLDAADSEFVLQLLELATDMQSGDNETETGIDHVYAVSVRGGDAMHLMHLAAMAYYFTGEEQYREFLYRELIGNLGTLDVADTMGAVVFPRWCRSFYGTHITITPLWDFLNLLDDSPLRTSMQEVMEQEMWRKLIYNLGHASMDLMYAGTVPADLASARDEAIARATATIRAMGGNGGVLEDPRRTYTVDRQALLRDLPSGVTAICPTEAQRSICEDGFEVFGLTIPGEDITGECTGAPGECPIGDGCALAQADEPLPVNQRAWADYTWQRNPFQIGVDYSVEGGKQSPGLDLIEAFWLARYYGFLHEGEGQVLAWQAVGTCP